MTESPYLNSLIEGKLNETRLEQGRAALLRVLRSRFPGPVPPEVVQTIREQPSLELLDDWLGVAATTPSLEAFIAHLRR